MTELHRSQCKHQLVLDFGLDTEKSNLLALEQGLSRSSFMLSTMKLAVATNEEEKEKREKAKATTIT